MYVYYDDGDSQQWVQANSGGSSGGGSSVYIGDVAPPGPSVSGDLWWQSDDGQMYVYYDDGDSQQWVQANFGGSSGGGSGGASVWVGDEPPIDPPAQGDLWWQSDEGEMYIYYDDGDSQQWVQSTANAGFAGPAGPQGEPGPTDIDEKFY
jgi:hypothetical protein